MQDLKPSSPSPVTIPASAHKMKRKMGLGQALLLPNNHTARDSEAQRRSSINIDQQQTQIFETPDSRQSSQIKQYTPQEVQENSVRIQQQQNMPIPEAHVTNNSPSIESEKDSFFDAAEEATSRAEIDKNLSDSISFDLAPPLPHPLLSSKHAEDVLQSPKPRVSFSDPLTIGFVKDLDMANSATQAATGRNQVDDLASPSLPAFESRSQKSRPASASSKPPTVLSPIKPFDPVKPAPRPPPRKRPVSQLGSTAPVPATPSPTLSPAPAKRLKSEEMQQRKAKLEAELKAKRERKAAIKKANDEEVSNRQEQQRLWAEEDAKRREEEARHKAAEEEAERRAAEEEAQRRAVEEEEARQAEEAFMAEMAALERENEMEDEDLESEIEKGERQRMEWEELMRARGLSEE
jgi:hypothetical protein